MDIFDRKEYLFKLFSEHIFISFEALATTTILGFILGVCVFYSSKSKAVVLPIVNFLYTIPSIAMFGLLIPLVGIGIKNALIVLILYGLLPMVRSTYTGLSEVRSDIVEAAKAMGASRYEIFRDVLFPLALPSILSALRVTTVMIVALTGLAALIGAGGLGQAIFRGLNTMNTPLIVTGSMGISLLAILGDKWIGVFENKLVRMVSKNATRRQKTIVYLNLALGTIVLLLAIISTNPLQSKQENSVTIATKPTSEQFILGEIIAQLVEKNSNIHVVRKFGIGGGTTNIHPAMLNGEIDITIEYTGTGWMSLLKEPLPIDNQINFEEIEARYMKQFNLKWLGLLGFNNTFALAITDTLARRLNIKTCSDLSRYSNNLRFGAEFDFFERPDGYRGLVKSYGFNFLSIHEMDINLRYNAIIEGKVDVIDAFTTDAKIVVQNLKVLTDDNSYFPSYEAGVVIRLQTLIKHPELKTLLTQLNQKISTESMMKMNHEVEVMGKSPQTVAEEFITKLLK